MLQRIEVLIIVYATMKSAEDLPLISVYRAHSSVREFAEKWVA